MAGSVIKCPVCGSNIAAGPIILTPPEATLVCSCCRQALVLVRASRLPVLIVSAFLSLFLCAVLELRGGVLVMTALAVGTVFYWIARMLRAFLAAPKLKRIDSETKPLDLKKGPHSSR